MSWKNNIQLLVENERKYGAQVKIVKYEDWMNSIDLYTQTIFDYFGLSYKSSVQDFFIRNKKRLEQLSDEAKDKMPARKLSILTKLSRPINPNKVSAWKTKLSKNEIQQCEMIAATEGIQLGYFPLYSTIPPLKRISIKIVYLHEKVLNLTLFKLRSNKIKRIFSVKIKKWTSF